MRISMLLCTLALSACVPSGISTPPEEKACAYMARETLPLPSSFKQVSSSSWDEPLTGAEMEELRARVPAMMNGTPGVRIAAIEFEFETTGGNRAQGAKICQFPTRDGNIIGGETGAMAQARTYVAQVLVGEDLGADFEMVRPVSTP
jgi:hypothetical protein